MFALPNPIPMQNKEGGRFEDEMQYDPSIIHKLKALYIAKQTAINKQNFEEAITLRNVIQKLKGYGVLLNKMEERKWKHMTKAEYKEARTVVKDMEQIWVTIADPKYLMSLDTCYQGDPERTKENMWGMRARFYSSMLPENDE